MILASAFGGLKALDSHKEVKGKQIAAAVASFAIALILAILAGYIIKKARRIGLCLLGVAAGFFIGFTLYNLVFALWIKHVAMLIVSTLGCAIAAGYLTYKYDKVVIVYLTSFIGAYSLIRGISVFAGSYPNEAELFSQISAGVFELQPAFYGYMAGFIACTILGIFVQHKLGYAEHKDDVYEKQ